MGTLHVFQKRIKLDFVQITDFINYRSTLTGKLLLTNTLLILQNNNFIIGRLAYFISSTYPNQRFQNNAMHVFKRNNLISGYIL
jgi:hypothetical protein